MLRERVLKACFLASFIMLLLSPVTSKGKESHYCNASSCGNIPNISYPFRLKGDPQHCGLQQYQLSCENNNRTILQSDSARYYVEEINYDRGTMRVVDVGLQKDNCSSLPLYSLTDYGFSKRFPYFLYYVYRNKAINFVDCGNPVNSKFYIPYDTAVCKSANNSLNSSSSLLQRHTYAVVDGLYQISDLEDSCSIVLQAFISYDAPLNYNNASFHSIHDSLLYGFDLYWYYTTVRYFYCDFNGIVPRCYSNCFDRTEGWNFGDSLSCIWNNLAHTTYYLDLSILILVKISAIYLAMVAAVKALFGGPCIFIFLVYKWRRRHLSMYDSIEEFIQSHNKLMPIRYSYSDIKKMTKGFKDKLGEGGYGSVYKGKLRSGHLVAVKILSNSKANGQDFINEVATIGRIHHVNVAPLIGYCAERSKRALLYDFMPNGSLEKYIFPREEGIIFLNCEKLYAISLGIARGIEYLHRGCDVQILHFDIKPHNILLDEKFTPKVSDFGLAKLYPTDDSIVNLTAARGTMGYMAPELFYKNIGGVSYKADVYSFGMLLMEMASKRKNLNPFVEHLSQIYFPSWVYDQFYDGNDIEMGDVTDEERNIAKKMMIVAFWCIQLKPTDRPSMRKVVEMLEGNVEILMPPKPFLSPQEIPVEDHGIKINPMGLSTSLGDSKDSDSTSLIVNSF